MKNHYNCIYMYTNKINGKKYVGQTKDLVRRHREHLKGDLAIDKAITKYGIDNFTLQILAENVDTKEKMNEYEIFFIKRYNTLTIGNGYNITRGGYSSPLENEEVREKLRELNLGSKNPFYGKKHSEETLKINKEKNSGANNPRARKLGQYTKEGQLVKIWDYARLAEQELGIPRGNISACCNGRQKSCRGFIWKYID